MKKELNKEVKSVINEYIDFCKGMQKQEMIDFIYKNIKFDYDLFDDNKEVYNYLNNLITNSTTI